jgi:hypothetical protein
MTSIESNEDLLAYLVDLEGEIRSKNMKTIADKISSVRSYSLNSATEFLGEARNLMMELVRLKPVLIGEGNIELMKNAIEKITGALS